jgi:hypothetical protein
MTIVNELLTAYNVAIKYWLSVKDQYQDVTNQKRSELIPEINKLIDPVFGVITKFPEPTDDCKELISQSFNFPDQLPEKFKAIIDGTVETLDLNEVETMVFPIIIARYTLAFHRIPALPTSLNHWKDYSNKYQKWVLKA